jgi:hypothetical protein
MATAMLSLVTSFLVGWVVLAAATQSPDFSGQWAVEPGSEADSTPPSGAARTVRGDMGSGWGSPLAITQDSKRLLVEYTPFTRYDLQRPLRFEYALDGSDTRNAMMIGHTAQELHSRARWDGPVLEITTRFEAAHPVTGKPFTTEVIQRVSLSSPGQLVVETSRTVPGAATTRARTVYKKSAPIP